MLKILIGVLLFLLHVCMCMCSFVFFRNPDPSEVPSPPLLQHFCEPAFDKVKDESEELCLPFHSLACCSSALVGGKGSKLALLKFALLAYMTEMVSECVRVSVCAQFDREPLQNCTEQAFLAKSKDFLIHGRNIC
jgi:hypothetical protein